MSDRLRGRVAVITGAGSGLGRATAQLFAAEGAAVACVDQSSAASHSTAAAITASGGRALPLEADVTSATDLARVVEATEHELGPIDVSFANAGIAGTGAAGDVDEAAWARVIAVNLTGVWLTSRAVLPGMVARGRGSVIHQASAAGIVGVPGIAPYAAAKAGVIGLTRQMAADYSPKGIRVNAIAPGTVPTPLVRATYDAGGGLATNDDEAVRRKFPLGRLGEPGDIASAALYLASDDSNWVTGTVLTVDGGMTSW